MLQAPKGKLQAKWGPAVFWMLAEHCRDFRLPFDLMIGVNRRVYRGGVYQGQDLFDQRTSLIQYAELFNAFPEVTFCVSVLSSSQNQELASYSWIFPNVVTSGHWWYSNIPAYIEVDLRARLQAVPKTKQIGYYSDMYKLEFGLPKFNMYRRLLAQRAGRRFRAAWRHHGDGSPGVGALSAARQCGANLSGLMASASRVKTEGRTAGVKPAGAREALPAGLRRPFA